MTKDIQRHEEKQPEVVQQRPWVAPLVDIYENEGELLLLADVPGVRSHDLKIHVEKDQLSIEGQVNEEPPGTSLGREYQTRDYRRTFIVPLGIDGTKIRAELHNGVLHLRLPKSKALKPRQIQVKAG